MILSEVNSSQNESVHDFTYLSEEDKGTKTEQKVAVRSGREGEIGVL